MSSHVVLRAVSAVDVIALSANGSGSGATGWSEEPPVRSRGAEKESTSNGELGFLIGGTSVAQLISLSVRVTSEAIGALRVAPAVDVIASSAKGSGSGATGWNKEPAPAARRLIARAACVLPHCSAPGNSATALRHPSR